MQGMKIQRMNSIDTTTVCCPLAHDNIEIQIVLHQNFINIFITIIVNTFFFTCSHCMLTLACDTFTHMANMIICIISLGENFPLHTKINMFPAATIVIMFSNCLWNNSCMASMSNHSLRYISCKPTISCPRARNRNLSNKLIIN